MNNERTDAGENAEQPIGVPRPPIPPPLRTADDDASDDYAALDRPITVWTVAEAILKHPGRTIYELHHGRAAALIGLQLAIAVVCTLAYGLTVGTFSLGTQLWAAPVKITAGILFSALICLPSLFVFSCLAGADSEPAKIVGSLSGVLTVSGLLLLAFGPVSWIFSQSTESIVFMGFLHLLFWTIAVYYGLRYLRQSVILLNGRGGAHLALWALIFTLVTLQMSTTLRPIVGTGDRLLQTEKKFFLTHWGEQMAQAASGEREQAK